MIRLVCNLESPKGESELNKWMWKIHSGFNYIHCTLSILLNLDLYLRCLLCDSETRSVWSWLYLIKLIFYLIFAKQIMNTPPKKNVYQNKNKNNLQWSMFNIKSTICLVLKQFDRYIHVLVHGVRFFGYVILMIFLNVNYPLTQKDLHFRSWQTQCTCT